MTCHIRLFWLIIAFAVVAQAQQTTTTTPDKVREALATQTCLEADVTVCRYDYTSNSLAVEAISFRPARPGRFPGILMIPGFQRTAVDLIPLGLALAREGFASVGVTQPGFGKSEGKADYVGPNTLRALTEGYRRFQSESYVERRKMGVYGYSRGGMAASLLAVKLDDVGAAVFGAGVYDFKKAHDDVSIEGIRLNMERESGMTEQAIRERSSVFQMERLKCPVLILHGDKDENVPVTQAYLLRDRLTELKKDFEIKIFPGLPHSIGTENVTKYTLDFFKRRLLNAKN
jgi:dipeptidyl aminopeptidase/acylaminoacyl peptidase